MTKTNPGYKPFKKKHVVIWLGDKNELGKSKGGIILDVGDSIENIISRMEEGVIIETSAGCFEGEDWDFAPKIGDEVCFKGYAGSIYEHENNFYRIMEDKFLTTPTIK
jgi:co-chaperonin GroES (HSP10)